MMPTATSAIQRGKFWRLILVCPWPVVVLLQALVASPSPPLPRSHYGQRAGRGSPDPAHGRTAGLPPPTDLDPSVEPDKGSGFPVRRRIAVIVSPPVAGEDEGGPVERRDPVSGF